MNNVDSSKIMSSSSEVDVLGDFEHTLKANQSDSKRKRRKKTQLSLYQTRHKGIRGGKQQPVQQAPRKRKIPMKKKPKVTFHEVDKKYFNDSDSTVGYSDVENALELNVTQTTLNCPEEYVSHDISHNIHYSSNPNFECDLGNAPGNDRNSPVQEANTYLDNCRMKLESQDVIMKVMQRFQEEDLLRHFMSFLLNISDGSLPVTNMSVVTCMERSFLQSLSNTVGMRYREDSHLFWEAVLHVGGPRVLRLFSSDKHFAQVVSDVSEKSKYDPMVGSFNFAVPDERLLRKSKTKIPTIVPCGIIEESFEMFNYSKQYVLSLDGKICSQGLREPGEGDINLWGYEGPPTLHEARELIQEQVDIIEKVKFSIEPHRDKLGSEIRDLKVILKITSERIQGLREAIVRHEKLRSTYQAKIKKFPGQASRYNLGFSEIDAFIARANDVIKQLLDANLEWCRIMSMIQQTEHCFKSTDTVCLDDYDNTWILLEPELVGDEDFLLSRPEFVKQRSDMWFELRQSARLTGSTMNNALGFRTLKDQTIHFNTFIEKKPAPEMSAFINKCMQHGCEHEIHAFGTVMSILMPAFLPRCHRLIEAGSFFIGHGTELPHFIEVSPDGLLECVEDCQQCDNRIGVPVGEIALEIKSPYTPLENPKMLPVHYVPPDYYICQLLAEMVATKRRNLWFVSSSLQSTTLCFIDYDRDTWIKLWNLATELYGDREPLKQISLHGHSLEYRSMIHDYIEANCLFAAEVPTVRCIDDKKYSNVPLPDKEMFRYRHTYPNIDPMQLNCEYINDCIVEACDVSLRLINEAYNLQRRKASELLLFVATDTDREFNKDIPMAIPVAYALKGKSIRVETARKMIADVRRKCNEKGLSVLLEAYDGQWSPLVFTSDEGKPLTLFEFDRQCWMTFANMSKDNILSFINSISHVEEENLLNVSSMNYVNDGEFQIGNVEFTIKHVHQGRLRRRQLSISSLCGPMNLKGVLFLLHTPQQIKRPFLWNIANRNKFNLLQILGLEEVAVRNNPNFHNAMTQTDDVLFWDEVDDSLTQLEHDMSSVPGSIGLSRDEVDVSVTHSQYVLDDSSIDSLPLPERIKMRLLKDRRKMLENILIAFLASPRFEKWQHLTLEQFYDKVFSSRHNIYGQLTVEEMKIVANEIRKHQCDVAHFEFKLSDNKVIKANELGFVFGLNDVVQVKPIKVKMRSLRQLSLLKLQRFVPVNVLRVALATFKFRIEIHDWLDASTMPISYEIPVEPYEFDLFSYPQRNVELDCVQPRLIDPSHILTNLRLHALQKGFFGCSKKAFIKVSQGNNKLLSRGLVEEPILDKQSVPFAQKLFSYEVQAAMEKNGDFREAEMVKNIRRWFNACNERGLSVSTRIKYLVDMHNYMMKHYKPGTYPMNTTHVDGLASTTFQAIMQNITTRIQLYHLAVEHTFCHRTASTLPVESMFADLNTLAKSTGGCPLALQIPRYIAKMTQFNAMKNDPTKSFTMRLTKKTNYPPMPADVLPDVVMTNSDGATLYRTHNFDKPEMRVRKKKYRRDFISFGNAPLRGKLPLRPLYFRVNESQIPAMTRFGYK